MGKYVKSSMLNILIPIVILFSFIILMVLNICSAGSKSIPLPKMGVIDLSQWDFNKDGNMKLDGDWEFYWNKLINYEDFKGGKIGPGLFSEVPKAWTTYSLDGKKLPGDGYGTYRLHVKTNVPAGHLLSFRLNTFSSSYRLWVNDKEIASNGSVSKTEDESIPEYKPLSAVFEVPSKEFDVIIQVSNFQFAHGGFWYSVYLGSVENIRGFQETLKLKEMFLIGVLIFAALNYLIIYLRMREARYSLYFSLLLFLMAIVIDMTGQLFISGLFPGNNFNLIVFLWYVSASWVITFLAVFTKELFPTKYSDPILKAFVIITTLATLVCIFTPVKFYTQFVTYYQVFEIIQILYTLALTVIGVSRKKEGAILYLTGVTVVLLSYIHDSLFLGNIIKSSEGEIMYAGVCILIFIQTLIQSKRFTGTYDENKLFLNRLKTVDKLKDEFLANTSHELRTPLNGIVNIAYGMFRDSNSLEQKQNLSLIISSGKRLQNLVNDVLDYSKIKNSDINLKLESVNLKSKVEKVLLVFEKTNINKDVAFLNDISDTIPLVQADNDRLTQIFYNLIGNAVKFTNKGYVKVSAQIIGEKVEVCIEDTGIGIPREKHNDIFISFEQIDTSITRSYKGTGLGLPITKQLVELHGGSIRVESTPGIGSRFYFNLPMFKKGFDVMTQNTALAESVAEADVYVTLPLKIVQDGPHVLLVDDDIINLYAAISILRQEGYCITAVTKAREALEIIKKDLSLSLVILDVMMPEISGYDICSEIRKCKTIFELPVLMLTARTGIPDIVTGFQAGANDYLQKPFEAEILLARVRTLVELKKSVDKALLAEVAFLQAQIKPHFLYNALTSISSLCCTNPIKAGELIDKLSIYLRGSFDFNNLEMFVPFKKELRLVDAYIEIEKARFEERLKVQYCIEEGLDFEILPLVIQPLVENAIRHGICKKLEGGTVKISIIKKHDEVLVSVEDDGVGLSESKLINIFDTKEERTVGLRNIHMRLKKVYSKGLNLTSEPGKGTTVSFTIPYKEAQ